MALHDATHNVINFYRKNLSENAEVIIEVQHPDLITVEPHNITIDKNKTNEWQIFVTGVNAGHSIVSANVTPNNVVQ